MAPEPCKQRGGRRFDRGRDAPRRTRAAREPGGSRRSRRSTPAARVELAGYDFRGEVERQFARYLENAWQPWAEAERRRRRLARLYVQLFTLHQELSGAITEAQVELVWGVGLGVWQHEATTVAYPLITRLVDLSFNPRNGAAEVRPRDLDPRLELDFYAAVDRPGVAAGREAGARLSGPRRHHAVALRAGHLRAAARDRQALPGLGR